MLIWLFGPPAVLSFALLLWQWLAARRFPLHRREGNAISNLKSQISNNSSLPPVTLLKPLKGCDAATEDCLRSWLAQDYAGEIQVLFGVASAEDPAGAVVRKLLAEYPQLDAQLVICGPPAGANAKVSKLAELETRAKHDLRVISDADVRVPPDLLANAVAPLTRPPGAGETGAAPALVSCFYHLANPATLAMHWEAVAVNADFWSQVLQARSMQPLDFALGAVMVTRREHLQEIGGFQALADCLADDYQLGHRLVHRGRRIELCPVVAECWHPRMGWSAVWRHQLRWARTMRVCKPAPYFFSVLSNATLWPLLWVLAAWAQGLFNSPTALPSVAIAAAAFILGRMLIAFDLQRRLIRSGGHVKYFWLAPVKDLLQAALWFCSFTGNRIEWRGEQFELKRDGTLLKLN